MDGCGRVRRMIFLVKVLGIAARTLRSEKRMLSMLDLEGHRDINGQWKAPLYQMCYNHIFTTFMHVMARMVCCRDVHVHHSVSVANLVCEISL